MDIPWQPGMKLDQIEKAVILKALRFHQNNKTKTAEALGISQKTLYNKLNEWGQGDGQTSSVSSEGRLHMEPITSFSPESPLSVREQPKVQEVPSKSASIGHSRKTR